MDTPLWNIVVEAVVGGLVLGIGGTLAFIRASIYKRVETMEIDTNKKIGVIQTDYDRRYDKVERQLLDAGVSMNLHAVQLGEMRVYQVNIEKALSELKEEGHAQNIKLDAILVQGGVRRRETS